MGSVISWQSRTLKFEKALGALKLSGRVTSEETEGDHGPCLTSAGLQFRQVNRRGLCLDHAPFDLPVALSRHSFNFFLSPNSENEYTKISFSHRLYGTALTRTLRLGSIVSNQWQPPAGLLREYSKEVRATKSAAVNNQHREVRPTVSAKYCSIYANGVSPARSPCFDVAHK